MKKFYLASTILVAVFLATATPSYASGPITVKQIVVGPQAGDKPTNFSLNIRLHNSGSDLTDWKFGFYMPRNFRRTLQSNLKLTMRICELGSNNCSGLNYQRAPFLAADLSTVFTTIVAPQDNFTLKRGKNYILSFMHNSSRGPQNYSALPQSLFIITPATVLNLTTSPANYSITDYNAQHTRQNIQQHLAKIWADSLPDAGASAIIPEPRQVALNNSDGVFKLSSIVKLHDLSNNQTAQTALWAQALKDDLALNVAIDKNPAADGILLSNVSNAEIANPEGYIIEISQRQINIKATNPAGFFYALQSLRQLWYQQKTLALLTISDEPRFVYRGILLDVARHYFSLAQLENFIDQMAAVKLNTLHLHLSDDEAFRLDLNDFPELNKIGSQRGLGLLIGPMAIIQKNLSKSQPDDKLPSAVTEYGYSYSQDEIKHLISYANLHQISVIPEIDIPGHSRALMKALPGSFHEASDTSVYAGYADDSLPICAYGSSSELGQKFTAALTAIIAQTAKLFTNQTTLYAKNDEISIGGDEVFKGTWDKAPSCQIAPWKDMTALQKEHYFLEQFTDDAKVKQLKFSGWHEFALAQNGQINKPHGISAEQIGHAWVWGKSSDSMAKAVVLANANYPVVLDYAEYLYFDMTYSPAASEPGFYWATKFGDSNAALSAGLAATKTQQQTKNPQQIMGLEGTLWTDVIPSYSQLQYMAFPKMAGLAEAAWSATPAAASNWRSLAKRLGCGNSGFLSFMHETYATDYRGFPHGIAAEAPQLCN